MATGKAIKYNDIANRKDINKLKKDFEDLGKLILKLKKEYANAKKSIGNNSLTDGKALRDYNKALLNATNMTEDMLRLKTQQLKTEKQLSISRTKEAEELARTKQGLSENNKQIRDKIKYENEDISSMNRMSIALAKNKRAYRALSDSERNNDKIGKKLLKTIRAQDKELKKLDNTLGDNHRSIGKYTNALKGIGKQFLGALGLTALISGFVNVLRSSFRTITQFDEAQATTAATLGKTRIEIKQLTADALEYGKATKYTAVEVSQLQNELAKLGYSMREISLMTDSILDLAEATGAELAPAAKVTGIAIKAFGLSALEAADINATLAVATTKSALSFNDFETILSTLGPIASAYGFSLADTIAFTGKLKDAGFDASSSATAFRNILLNLADTNGDLAVALGGSVGSIEELIPALVKLKDDGIDLNETLQLTDKRSVAAFNTLLQGADDILVLRDSIQGVNSEFDEMIGTKTDNTVAAMSRMGSAWDGVVLKFKESSGFFTWFFDSLATNMNIISDDTISFFEALDIFLTGGRLTGSEGLSVLEQHAEAIDKVKNATIDELGVIFRSYTEQAAAGDAFSIKMIGIVTNRMASIEEAKKLAADRELAAEKERVTKLLQEQKRLSDAIKQRQGGDIAAIESISIATIKNEKIQSATLEELAAKNTAYDSVKQEIFTLEKDRMAQEEMDKQVALSSTGALMTELSGMMAQGSEEQKAFAVAGAIIDTYQTISGILKGFAALPQPYGMIAGGVAAATAGVAGFARVQSILNTPTPKAESYFDGTDYVELNGNPKGRDTIKANLNEGERVVPTDINGLLMGVPNAELPSLVAKAKGKDNGALRIIASNTMKTNELLKRFAVIYPDGSVHSLDGNIKYLA